MLMNFKTNGIRQTNFQFSKGDIEVLKNDWKTHISKIKKYPNSYSGKGIVYTAGGVSYITCAWVSISLLRRSGCNLPIEIWHLGNEISHEIAAKFKGLDVIFRDFYENGSTVLNGYMLKPLAILYSSFEEVLFLDADNNCIKDPEYLFSLALYEENGCIFWPDFWHTSKTNSIWKIVESKAYDIPEQESGQILINKKKCWNELQLTLYFNQLSEHYYKILLGDKDTFKFAWLALETKFHMVEHAVGSCGYKLNGVFYGTTMVQHDPFGEILFLHRNLLKWDVTQKQEISWEYIKRFNPHSKEKKIFIRQSPRGGLAVEIAGDIIESQFNEIGGNLEKVCLEYLEQWREAADFKVFLEYTHFAKNRYPSYVPFNLVQI
jgi:alpha 1,2-mannosyltransferase